MLLYTQGDNSDIVATDTQKNTVYLLAKRHGVGSPEQFALLMARHFIDTYPFVVKAKVGTDREAEQMETLYNLNIGAR